MSMRAALVAFLAFLPLAAHAQAVYTWRETHVTRMSNVAPRWYRPDAPVYGPRVIVTLGKTVIDDTSLPLEKRMELARKPALKALVKS